MTIKKLFVVFRLWDKDFLLEYGDIAYLNCPNIFDMIIIKLDGRNASFFFITLLLSFYKTKNDKRFIARNN